MTRLSAAERRGLWAITVAQVADAKGESMRDAGSRVAARLEAIWPTEKHH